MKKVTVILKTLVLLVMSASAMANSTSALKVTSNASHIMVSLNTASEQSLEIKIQNEDGQVVYTERSTKSDLSNKKYDLSELPTGEYVLVVSQGNTTRVQPFIKDIREVLIDQTKVLTYYAPSFTQEMDYVDMNLLCSQDFETAVRIFDVQGRVLYKESVPAGGKIEKRFNLSQLEGGAYTFSVEVVSPTYENLVYNTFEVESLQVAL